jgi:hypothetical protein
VFVLSAWDQPATVVEGTKGEGGAYTSVRFVSVGSHNHSCGGHDR